MINLETVLEKANKEYARLKQESNPFTAPELLPQEIRSDQIKALAKVLIEAINEELDAEGI